MEAKGKDMASKAKPDQHVTGLSIAEIVRRLVWPSWESGFDEAPGLFVRNRFREGSPGAFLDEIERRTWIASHKVQEAYEKGCSKGEIELLREEEQSRYDEYERAKLLAALLPSYPGDSNLGNDQDPRLDFVLETPGDQGPLRFTPHSVFFWILKHQGLKVPEWAPPYFDLLLMIAWLLDSFMEINVAHWKTVMVTEPKPPEVKTWFRGNDLKVQAVTDVLIEELNEDKDASRTIKKHITTAKSIIFDDWRIATPLKPREVELANRTLYGLARATLKAGTKNDHNFRITPDSPEQVIEFMIEKFTRPPGLSEDDVSRCLRQCWG